MTFGEALTSDSARTPCSRRTASNEGGIGTAYPYGRGDDPPDSSATDAGLRRPELAPQRAPLRLPPDRLEQFAIFGAAAVTYTDVAASWRIRGDQYLALRDRARTLGLSVAVAKSRLAYIGLIFAWAEYDHVPSADQLIRKARSIARRELLDCGPPPPQTVPLLETEPEPEPAIAPEPSAQHVTRTELMCALVTAPQQRALMRAFLVDDASTLADAERVNGWSPGHASALAGRIRRKCHALY